MHSILIIAATARKEAQGSGAEKAEGGGFGDGL
jgi:hypothetical protein